MATECTNQLCPNFQRIAQGLKPDINHCVMAGMLDRASSRSEWNSVVTTFAAGCRFAGRAMRLFPKPPAPGNKP